MDEKTLSILIRYCDALISIKELLANLPDPEILLQELNKEKNKSKRKNTLKPISNLKGYLIN
jgi:hypothetical protein